MHLFFWRENLRILIKIFPVPEEPGIQWGSFKNYPHKIMVLRNTLKLVENTAGKYHWKIPRILSSSSERPVCLISQFFQGKLLFKCKGLLRQSLRPPFVQTMSKNTMLRHCCDVTFTKFKKKKSFFYYYFFISLPTCDQGDHIKTTMWLLRPPCHYLETTLRFLRPWWPCPEYHQFHETHKNISNIPQKIFKGFNFHAASLNLLATTQSTDEALLQLFINLKSRSQKNANAVWSS